MTSNERVSRILSGKDADRPATFDILMNDEIIKHFAGEDPDPLTPEPIVHRAISKALDSTRVNIIYPQKQNEETLDNGLKVRRERWTNWYTYPIASVEEAESYVRKRIHTLGNAAPDLTENIREYLDTKKELMDTFFFGNFLLKTGIMLYSEIGLDNFCYLLSDQPELLRDYFEVTTRRSVFAIETTHFPSDIEAIFDCEDIAYRGGTLFSREVLKKDFFPRLERIVDAWHRKGITFIFHSDGNLMEAVPDLVACEIDGLNPLETQAGLDLRRIRPSAPDLVLIGGVDCSRILPYGTPDQVRQETRRVIETLGPRSLIGSSSEVHNAIPIENYLALLETVHNWKW